MRLGGDDKERSSPAPPHHALVVALLANAVAAAVKLAAFAVTGAPVLLSEGVHSVADCGNQGALLLGHRSSSNPPSARYPLGLGRPRYLWAFLVAVVVFGGSALVAFAEATYRLLNPAHHPEHAAVTLAALAVAVAIDSVSIVLALREARPAKGDERAVMAAVGTGRSGWQAASVPVVHLGPAELLVVVMVGDGGGGGGGGGGGSVGGAGRGGDELSGWLAWAGRQAAAAAAPLAARVLFEVDDGEPWTP